MDGRPAGIRLNEAKYVEIHDGGGQVVLRGEFSDYQAPLANAGTDATGLAEIEIEKAGTDLEQEIEVAVENLPPSATFKLVVHQRFPERATGFEPATYGLGSRVTPTET